MKGCVVGCVLFCILIQSIYCDKLEKPQTYATLLYGSDYALAVRVLYRSLKTSGAKNPLLVLCTPDVPQHVKDTFVADGMVIKTIDHIHNPFSHEQKFEKRFFNVLAKLNVFALVEYSKVVYIDSDAFVLANPDDLFECGNFCAVFINPCAFNSGLMVLQPSREIFEDMIKKLSSGTSYDGGDQGFLNEFFDGMLESPLWKSGVKQAESKYKRIPFGYHLDHSHFYVNFKWTVICKPYKVVEFLSLPQLKPWQWWAYFFADLSWDWHVHRKALTFDSNLEPSTFLLIFLAVAPVVLFSALLHYKTPIINSIWMKMPIIQMKSYAFYGLASIMNAVLGILSLGFAFLVIPPKTYPFTGLFLFIWWFSLFYTCFMGSWFIFCHKAGHTKKAKNRIPAEKKGTVRIPVVSATLAYVTLMIYIIFTMYILSRYAFFSALMYKILYCSLNIVFVVFYATYFSLRLSAQWYQCGKFHASL